MFALATETKARSAGRVAACLLLLATAGTAFGADSPWIDPADVPIPPLHKIQVPQPDRVELPGGMVVYFLEDHDFPIVDMRAMIRVGSIYDPPEKVGLASITGQVMRTGGTTHIDGDALDLKLESMGASVEVSIGSTQGTATASVLSENVADGVSLLADVLRNPAFPQEKIDLAKKQERTDIASRNDEALDIAIREALALVYGPDHPYARHTEYATIDAITRDDLVEFHRTYFHPDRAILTVYGDFQTSRMKKLLTDAFAGWPTATSPLPPDPVVKPTDVTGLFVADKEKTTNTVILVGQEGMRYDDPDYPAMQVYHSVMGTSGFASRLMNEIRSKRGLAYATGSSSGAGIHHPGAQLFYAITQIDSTASTLTYLDQEIERSLTEPFSEEEMRLGKDAILNSLVFDLSSKGAVLNRMAAYEFYGYPIDFLTRYQEGVSNATADEVLAAARRQIRYPEMATLIVGEMGLFTSQLQGDYTVIDVSIPEPGGAAAPPAGEADLARGQELLAAAALASGGESLAEVADLTVKESGTLTIQGNTFDIASTTVIKMPDCIHVVQKLPMGAVTQSFCGGEGWVDMMQGPQAMPAELVEESKAEQTRSLLNVLLNYPDLTLQALPGTQDVNGETVETVLVQSDQVKGWKIFLDPTDHRIAGMEYRDRSMTGAPTTAQLLLGDYREVAGIQWPYSRTLLQDGEPVVTLQADSVMVNTGVDAAFFKMP